jgi:hypothetical protein
MGMGAAGKASNGHEWTVWTAAERPFVRSLKEREASMPTDDALVGLRFEVGGGLGRMSGRVLGKVGNLYLVQKSGAEHMELLELDDIRSARFFADETAVGAREEPSVGAPAPKKRLSEQLRRHFSAKDGG